MNVKFWTICLIFYISAPSNGVLGVKVRSVESVLSGSLQHVKKLYNFNLNGVSYHESSRTMAKVVGGNPSYAPLVTFWSRKTAATLSFDQAKSNLLSQFNMNQYEKFVAMLPSVVQAIEDTIFEDEPSWQVSFDKTGGQTLYKQISIRNIKPF